MAAKRRKRRKHDQELARKLNRTLLAVRVKRQQLGIPLPPSATPVRPWSKAQVALLGTLPDAVLAREIGRTPTAVAVLRCRRHVPPFGPRPHRWTTAELALLGRFPDSEV